MRKICNFLALAAALFLFIGTAGAGGIGIPSTRQSTGLRFDVLMFRGDSGRAYVEFVYSFPDALLRYVKSDTVFKGGNLLQCDIRESDTIVINKVGLIPRVIRDTTGIERSGHTVVGLLRFHLPQGSYSVRLTAADVNEAARQDSVSFKMVVPAFQPDSVTMSDVELCASLRDAEGDAKGIFYKNTFEVVPNPSATFGGGSLLRIYYYTELYGLNNLPAGRYALSAQVLNSAQRVVLKREKKKSVGPSATVEVGLFDISTLPSGVYVLKLTVSDSSHGLLAGGARKFFVYNPGVARTDTIPASREKVYLQSEYGVMPEADLDHEFELDRYTAAPEEIKQYDELHTVEAKREFLYNFWKVRDTDPLTAVNELKTEYMERVAFVNQQFGTGNRPGWKTDRGRVYVVYGKPDEIERHPNESDMKPYEIWYYNSIQGGVQFIFVDRSGFSDYILVHSTHRDELHDENWMNQARYY